MHSYPFVFAIFAAKGFCCPLGILIKTLYDIRLNADEQSEINTFVVLYCRVTDHGTVSAKCYTLNENPV